MTRAARVAPVVEIPGSQVPRRPARMRSPQVELAFEGPLRRTFGGRSDEADRKAAPPTGPHPIDLPRRLAEFDVRAQVVDLRGSLSRSPRWASLQEGAREVFVTLLATIVFGLGWAAIEAGQANSALARDGIPAAVAVEVERETTANARKAAVP